MSRFKTLRLILGDQLNYKHSWFQTQDDSVLYVLMEVRQETDYTVHHIQKIIAFFASMYNFAAWLRKKGHLVHHFLINDPDNTQSIADNLNYLIRKHGIIKFEYMLPDEYRLDEYLRKFCDSLDIESRSMDTEHFLTCRSEFQQIFKGRQQYLMETFYRYMRKKHNILMGEDGQPAGGSWNYDKENRLPVKSSLNIPDPLCFHHDYSDIFEEINRSGIRYIGESKADAFLWPTTRRESLLLMHYFNENLLASFGKYQDAMHTESWSLYHSRLSFAMNVKMISPMEVIQSAIKTWIARPDVISIAQIEGYVRQILGWREYMRGIYWTRMPEFASLNYLEHSNKLPEWYWSGKTKMQCLGSAIRQSLDHAYAHHIQRLMVTGNFALLAGVHPDEVDQWYLGIYIDAIEWVEITNTRGMSQYADGGIVGTKPYVSSANYIHKMSNYCQHCFYNHKLKTGEKACPFNSLYWHYYIRNEAKLRSNPRIGMAYVLLDKMTDLDKASIVAQAEYYLNNLDSL